MAGKGALAMRFILSLLIWLGLAAGAQAGAWPRGEGKLFFALDGDRNRTSLYAEYGLRGDWTMGTEVAMPKGRRLPDVTSFLHHPVWRGKGGAILSAGLAFEVRETVAAKSWAHLTGLEELALRAGLFWGKGFETPWGGAWATADLQVEQILTTDWLGAAQTVKLDLGLGLKPTDRVMLMAQAQGWQRKGGAVMLRLETTAAYRVGPAQIVLQPSVGLRGPRDPRLRLGLWLDF